MSRLHILNFYFLQWLCIRVARSQDSVRIIDGFDLYEVSMTPNGAGIGGKIRASHVEETSWWCMFLAAPLSGYDGRPWKYFSKQLRISKKKTIVK